VIYNINKLARKDGQFMNSHSAIDTV